MSHPSPALLPIFRSAQQLRLLGDLFVNAGSAYSITDLSRRTGIPQATVSREVARLRTAGLVATSTMGRMTLVQANEASPYFSELRSLLMKAAGPAAVLRELLSRVAGIEEAYIFGSWAERYEGIRGPAPADIDVVVIGDVDPDAVDAACREAGDKLGLETNAVVLSRAEWDWGESGFLRRVRNGPRVSLTGNAA